MDDPFDFSDFFDYPKIYSNLKTEQWHASSYWQPWRRDVNLEDLSYPPEWACFILNNLWAATLALLVVFGIWHASANYIDKNGMSAKLSKKALVATPPLAAVLFAVKIGMLMDRGYDLTYLFGSFLMMTGFIVFLLAIEGSILLEPFPNGKRAIQKGIGPTIAQKRKVVCQNICLGLAGVSALCVIVPILTQLLLIGLAIIVFLVAILFFRR